MLARIACVFLFSGLLFGAAKKTIGTARGENQDLILTVTIYTDGPAVKDIVGDDLQGHFTVAQVKVEPKYTKEIVIDRDDFLLRTEKNGDRSKPMAPSQIAGRGALILSRDDGPAGQNAERTRGWSIGGMGGGGNGIGAGGGVDTRGTKATMQTGDKDNPLKKVLEDKILPEKKIEEPVTGLLYFPLEGQKLKDLELVYGGKENRIRLRFQ